MTAFVDVSGQSVVLPGWFAMWLGTMWGWLQAQFFFFFGSKHVFC